MLKVRRYKVNNYNLDRWIKFIWHLESENESINNKLLPMDSIDLIINNSDEIVYETKTKKIIAPKIHINGIRGEHSFVQQNGKINVWGISFYAYGIYPFINKSLKHIQNQIIDLNEISNEFTNKLEKAIKMETNQLIANKIIEVLCSEINIKKNLNSKVDLLVEFINAQDIPISDFCENKGINIKTFERLVLTLTGYTPINLKRIKKYSIASKDLIFDKSVKIAEIVYNNNYSDQAYFTKECNKFSGSPPKKLIKEKNTILENIKYL